MTSTAHSWAPSNTVRISTFRYFRKHQRRRTKHLNFSMGFQHIKRIANIQILTYVISLAMANRKFVERLINAAPILISTEWLIASWNGEINRNSTNKLEWIGHINGWIWSGSGKYHPTLKTDFDGVEREEKSLKLTPDSLLQKSTFYRKKRLFRDVRSIISVAKLSDERLDIRFPEHIIHQTVLAKYRSTSFGDGYFVQI